MYSSLLNYFTPKSTKIYKIKFIHPKLKFNVSSIFFLLFVFLQTTLDTFIFEKFKFITDLRVRLEPQVRSTSP